jgi:hypothetical protein
MKKRVLGLLLGGGALLLGDGPARETPAQMRRIVAQSLCLAGAYPGTALAKDAEAVYALYATQMGAKDPLGARRKVEALVAKENPGKLTPVGERNLALAKCALFAERADVLAILKGGR